MNNGLCKSNEEKTYKQTNKHGVDMNGCDGKSGGTKKKKVNYWFFHMCMWTRP